MIELVNPPPAPPAPPAGPPGGYGIGLPPGVDPMLGAGGDAGGGGQGGGHDALSIVSLVLGIVAIPLWGCCGPASLAVTIVGLILGFVALGRIKREPGRYGSSKTIAIVALVINGGLTVLIAAMMIFFVGIMGFGILSAP